MDFGELHHVTEVIQVQIDSRTYILSKNRKAQIIGRKTGLKECSKPS